MICSKNRHILNSIPAWDRFEEERFSRKTETNLDESGSYKSYRTPPLVMVPVISRTLKSLFVLLFLLISCVPALTARAESGWVTVEREFWKLHFPRELGEDARAVDEMMSRATEELSRIFGEPDAKRLLGSTVVDVLTHPEDCRHASANHASMESNLRKDGYRARIHLLAPSAFPRQTFRGQATAEDDDPYYRILLHEYSAVFVQRLILTKEGGWRYQEADEWFLQGFDEFVACRVADGPKFAEKLEKQRNAIRRQPRRVQFTNRIQVADPYEDGMALVAFLHDNFGDEVVRSIWLSGERSFDRAVENTLGTDYNTLQTKWEQWLIAQS